MPGRGMALVLVGGCSFGTLNVPARVAPDEPLDCSSGWAVTADTATSTVLLGTAAAIAIVFTYGGNPRALTNEPAVVAGELLLLSTGVPYAASAIYGHVEQARCERLQREQAIARVPLEAARQLEARAREQEAQRKERAYDEAREHAWELTKQAQQSARDGDCANVRAIALKVKADAGDWYNVFMRDTAIAACVNASHAKPAPAQPAPAPVQPAQPAPALAQPAPASAQPAPAP